MNVFLTYFRLFQGCTCLHWAAGTNQVETIRYLVTRRGVPVDICATKKARGRSPLHYAARNGSLEAAQLLVEMGANVNVRAKNGVSPFQLAVWQNNLEICRWLVRPAVCRICRRESTSCTNTLITKYLNRWKNRAWIPHKLMSLIVVPSIGLGFVRKPAVQMRLEQICCPLQYGSPSNQGLTFASDSVKDTRQCTR